MKQLYPSALQLEIIAHDRLCLKECITPRFELNLIFAEGITESFGISVPPSSRETLHPNRRIAHDFAR